MALTNTKSLAFVGTSSQYVTMGDVLGTVFNRFTSFSVSWWMKTTTTVSSTILARQNESSLPSGWVIYTNGTEFGMGLVHTWSSNMLWSYCPGLVLNNGSWHHCVATYDGSGNASGMLFYVDGLSVTRIVSVSNLNTSVYKAGVPFTVARRDISTSYMYYTGSLDEIAIYNKALTTAEVGTISTGVYDLTVIGPTANLIGYWRMGDGDTYPMLTDRSVGAHSGTMVNMGAGSIVTDSPYNAGELSLPAASMFPLPLEGTSWDTTDMPLSLTSMTSFSSRGVDVSVSIGEHAVLTIMNSTYGAHVRRAVYKMRGKKADDSFETWTAVGESNTLNPSGAPLTEVVISDRAIWVSD